MSWNRSIVEVVVAAAVAVVVLLGAAPAAHAAPCELPTPKACYDKGVAAFKAKDAAAAEWFAKACESGEAEGCTELGFLLMEGMLVARDDKRSLQTSLRACELGSGLGCNNAFVLVRDGRGGKKRDDLELRRLADRSCELGDGEGCYLSAAVHGEPIGGERDEARSSAALEKSCKLEFGMACAVIAHRRLEGSHGYERDEARGVRLMARACELGSGEGCTLVAGWILAGEHGLVADGEKALELFARACELEDRAGCESEKKLRAASASGTLEARLVRRSSKRVLLAKKGGDTPPAGAVGELSKRTSVAGVDMRLTIAKVEVTRVEGSTVELVVSQDLSVIEIDGKQVDHWEPGIDVEVDWQRPAERR